MQIFYWPAKLKFALKDWLIKFAIVILRHFFYCANSYFHWIPNTFKVYRLNSYQIYRHRVKSINWIYSEFWITFHSCISTGPFFWIPWIWHYLNRYNFNIILRNYSLDYSFTALYYPAYSLIFYWIFLIKYCCSMKLSCGLRPIH